MQGGFYRTTQPLITNDEARDGRKCPRHRGGAREGFHTFCLRFQHLSHALPRCLGVAGESIPALSLSRRIMLQHWGCCGGEKGGDCTAENVRRQNILALFNRRKSLPFG